MTPSGSMPKAAATMLGVKGVHQLGEPGAPQGPRWDATGVKDVADIGGRGCCLAGFGDLGDDHVGVAGVLALAVGQASLKHRPAGRVHGHWMRPFAQADAAVGGVKVVHAQEPHLTAGGRVEEGQDSEQCLVRVRVGEP